MSGRGSGGNVIAALCSLFIPGLLHPRRLDRQPAGLHPRRAVRAATRLSTTDSGEPDGRSANALRPFSRLYSGRTLQPRRQ